MRARRSKVALLIAVSVLAGVACGRPAGGPGEPATRRAAEPTERNAAVPSTSETTTAAGSARVPTVYSDDPHDPWNRIFELLFASPVEWTEYVETAEPVAPPQLEGRSVEERRKLLHDYFTARFLTESVPRVREHAEDVPDFFHHGLVEYLLEDPRHQQLTAALVDELERPTAAGRTTVARVLFQQDLWNRFLAVQNTVRQVDGVEQVRGAELAGRLGGLIAAVAVPPEELRRIPGNFASVAAAHDALDPRLFAEDSVWGEVLALVDGRPYMSHTLTAAGRRVFRTFLRVPGPGGSRACLEANMNRLRFGRRSAEACATWGGELPTGSRVLLVETPVAIATTGERVPLPLVLGIELRAPGPIEPGDDGRFGLDDLPVRVFHASRRSLIEGGGLERVAPDEPVPPSLSAFGNRGGGALEPLALTCRRCHTLEGRHLMTGAVHQLDGFRVVHPDNAVQEDALARPAGATAAGIDAYFPRGSAMP